MIEINLIPDVKRELIRAQRARAAVVSIAIIVSIVAVGIVLLLAAYAYGIQAARGAIADSSIKKEYEKLSSIEDISKMVTIQNQLSKIPGHNDNKSVSSRIFKTLSAVVPPAPNEVKISQVNVDLEESIITLEGQTDGYESMEIFKKTLDNAVVSFGQDTSEVVELASDISMNGVGLGEDSEGNRVLRFTVSFSYAEELFSSTSELFSINLRRGGNVTDSYLGIPRSIFAQPAKDIEE